jgi:uncharacterized membrane protein YbhN (UPF0104 family)
LSFRSSLQSGAAPTPDASDLAEELGTGSSLLPRRAPSILIALVVVVSIVLAVLGVMGDRPHNHLRIQLAWLPLAVLVLAALELMQAELWSRLLRALGGELDSVHALSVWCVSALARYVPTSMLMPIVRVRMSRARSVRGDVCIASLIYEGVLVNCGAACVGAYFVITLPTLRGEGWRWGVMALPVAAISVLHPRVFATLSGRVLRRARRLPLAVHLSVGQLLRFTAGYIASFVLAGLGLVVVVLMLHGVSWQGVPTIVGAMAIGFIASAFAFVLPGGLGAREAALVAALTPIMPTFVAATAAVVLRLIQLGIEVTLALLLPWVARRRDTRQSA